MEQKIKAGELRINNLLYYKGTTDLAKVKLINAPSHFDCVDEYGSFTPNGKYEPIPLTEEWLVRFGFEYDQHTKQYSKTYTRRESDKESLFIFGYEYKFKDFIYFGLCNSLGESVAINTVYTIHSLQNSYYAITGSELTLNDK